MTVLRSLRTKSILAAAAAGLMFLSACGESASAPSSGSGASGEGKTTIVFAAVPSEESTSLQAEYETIIKLIEKDTGKKVEFQNATDYAAVIEGQRAGKIDIAAYGPFSYKIAKDGGVPVEPLASLVDAPDEKPGYFSIGWVKSDNTEITSIEAMKGKKICFVDKASTSGYLYPSAGLLGANINPETDITPVMAGGHDASLLSIKSGQCDAGFAYEEMQTQMVAKGQLADGEVKEIWRSEQIMGSPFAMNTETLDSDTQDKLRAMVEKANKPDLVAAGICTDEASCNLPEEKEWGMVKVTDADYDGVRKVCDLTKAEACNKA
ncbi:phosphate/phosphite/phosphonate ABC transporter substrate-binding protein [Ammonicoccus fulvus]|uniref:Phosphate/phosphite/phosphonate ABC transporter substrate-binding protein n=1 Tax=Ammonicoccus fulvus TaxID=3138240 RepID=A0ABZ3FJX4_9ACTN